MDKTLARKVQTIDVNIYVACGFSSMQKSLRPGILPIEQGQIPPKSAWDGMVSVENAHAGNFALRRDFRPQPKMVRHQADKPGLLRHLQ